MIRPQSGFTLIELMVVIAIIGILASVVLSSLDTARYSARVVAAQGDLRTIQIAVTRLQNDTQQSPGGFSAGACYDSNAVLRGNALEVDHPRAGLLQNDTDVNTFPNWKGPYLNSDTILDPWGRKYLMESRYLCTEGEVAEKNGQCVAGEWYSAIQSRGANGSPINTYDADNIALILCQ